jgi:hypothetical protein
MYPKTFFAEGLPDARPGTCFVVMPFSRAFEPVFRLMKGVLEEELGLACTRTDELLGGGNIIEDILRQLATSEMVLVDVTGRNPNVFYELGIAHMCKPVEKVLLLSQEVDSIPFDLRPFRHIVYKATPRGLQALARELREAVGAVGERIHRIFLDNNNRGLLPERLMGPDHCLYEFEVSGGFSGFEAAKVSLKVTRHYMTTKPHAELAYHNGFGLNLGEIRSIPGVPWTIGLERSPRGPMCFRIEALTQNRPRDTRAPKLNGTSGGRPPAKAQPRNKLTAAADAWVTTAESARAAKTIVPGSRLPRALVTARNQFEEAWNSSSPAARRSTEPASLAKALSLVNRVYRVAENDSSIKESACFWADEAIRHFSDTQDRQNLTEALLDKAAIYLELAQLGHDDRVQFETMAREGDALMTRAYQTCGQDQRAEIFRISSRFFYALARPKSFRLSEDWDNNYLLLAYEKAAAAYKLAPDDIKNANQMARTAIKASKTRPQDIDAKWTKRLHDCQRKLKKAWLAAKPRLTGLDERLSPLNVLGVVTLEYVAREWNEMNVVQRKSGAAAFLEKIDVDALSPLRDAVALLNNSELRKAYGFDLHYDIARALAMKTAISRTISRRRAEAVFAELKANLSEAREGARATQLDSAIADVNREITFTRLTVQERDALTELLAGRSK